MGCDEGWIDNGEDCMCMIEILVEYENCLKRVIKELVRVVEEVIFVEYKIV